MHEVFVNWDEYQDYISYGDILYNTDGLDASIVVMEWGDGGRTLYINGKPDASVMGNFDDGFSGDMNNQLVTGHLPMLTHGNAKEVLVVGQGSGVSVMAAASYPDANVELVELSGEIIETAPYFAAGNLGYYDWPNVKIIQEDARTYLFLEEKKYDVIINEPSNPWVAGNASLFTKEYMEACAAKLNDGGIFYQWVQTYETSQDAHDLIMRTYESVFPYYSIWKVSPGDTGVIGSMRPIEIDLGRVLELMEQTEINRQLASVGMEIPEVLFGFQFFQNGALGQGAPYEPSGLFNSEFTPLLEYQAPLSFFIDESVPNLHERDQRFHPLESQLLLRHQYMTADFDRKSFAEDRWQFAQARYDSQNSSVPDPTLEILGGWLKQHPESADAALVLQTQSEYISAESRVEKLSQLDPGEFTDSSRYYRELGEAALELAHLKWRLGQAFDQETTLAIEQFEALIKLEGDQAWEAHQFLGRAHVLAGDLAKASEHYQQALSIGEESAGEVGYYLSDHHPLVKEMVRLYAHLGDAETLQQLVPRLRRDPNASLYLGRAYNHLVEAGVIEVDQ
jgi:spermidine synthase